MRCAFMNRRLKILPLTVSVLLCVNTHSAFSFDNLRPASILNAQGSADDIAFLTGRNNRASASGMMIESGLCNSLPKVARGKAAFVSTYSAYDIMRNLNRQYKKEATFAERIDREKTVVLPQLIEELAEAVKNAGHAQAAILLQGENGYRDKVERYLEERKQAIVDNGQLIRNSIGALEFFLAIDLRKAKAGHDEVKTEQLRLLLGETQKKALADMDRTPDSLLTDKQADLLWDEYEAARETVAVQYKTQAESYKRMQNEIEVKMRALSRRNRMLLNYALQAHEQGDTEEAHALQDTVRANISLLKQCEKARENFNQQSAIFEAMKYQVDDIHEQYIKSKENMILKNRTPMQLMYIKGYALCEKIALGLDPFSQETHKTYTVMTDIMRIIESIMMHASSMPHFYVKESNTIDNIILLSNYELSADMLIKLLDSYENRIKAVCVFEGTLFSHALTIAHGRGVPVVLLRDSKHSAEDIASIGDNIIVETSTEQGTVIVRPDAAARKQYDLVEIKQALEEKFALTEHFLRQAKPQQPYNTTSRSDKGIKVLSTATSAKAAKNINNMRIQGIGLYRTEFGLSRLTEESLKHYIERHTDKDRKQLLESFVGDMYDCLMPCRNCTGPVVMRTDDYEADKDIAGVAAFLGTRGFDLYRSKIGQDIVTLRIASYYIALYRIKHDALIEKMRREIMISSGQARGNLRLQSIFEGIDSLLPELAQDINNISEVQSTIERLIQQLEANMGNALTGNGILNTVTVLMSHLSDDLKANLAPGSRIDSDTARIFVKDFADGLMAALAAQTKNPYAIEARLQDMVDTAEAMLYNVSDPADAVIALFPELAKDLHNILTLSAIDEFIQQFIKNVQRQFGFAQDKSKLLNLVLFQLQDDIKAVLASSRGDLRAISRLLAQLREDLMALMRDAKVIEDAENIVESLMLRVAFSLKDSMPDMQDNILEPNIILNQLSGRILELASEDSAYRFTPIMIFPMVKEQRDMQFMRKDVIPQAREIARNYLNLSSDAVLPYIETGPMIETVEAYDNINSIIGDINTALLSIGNSDFAESVLSRESELDITRDDEFFEPFFTMLKPDTCKKYYKIAQALSAWNNDYPGNRKTLGFCGAQAATDEFILFACFLQQEFGNVPIHISVPAYIVPQTEMFIDFIDYGQQGAGSDLDVFKTGIGFKTHALTQETALKIRERIKASAGYKKHVEGMLAQALAEGVDGVIYELDFPETPAASSCVEILQNKKITNERTGSAG